MKVDDPAPKAQSEDENSDPEYNPQNPFQSLTFGFKIGPTWPQSYAQDNDKDSYLQRMSLVSGRTENDDVYDKESVGEIDSEYASPKYFKWDRWGSSIDHSFQFQPLMFSTAKVPIGESPHYCLGLEIAGADDKADFEKFKGLEKGFS